MQRLPLDWPTTITSESKCLFTWWRRSLSRGRGLKGQKGFLSLRVIQGCFSTSVRGMRNSGLGSMSWWSRFLQSTKAKAAQIYTRQLVGIVITRTIVWLLWKPPNMVAMDTFCYGYCFKQLGFIFHTHISMIKIYAITRPLDHHWSQMYPSYELHTLESPLFWRIIKITRQSLLSKINFIVNLKT